MLTKLCLLLLSSFATVDQEISTRVLEMEHKFDLISNAKSESEESASFRIVLEQTKRHPTHWVSFLLNKALGKDQAAAWNATILLSDSDTALADSVMSDIVLNAQHWTVRNVALRRLSNDFHRYKPIIVGLSIKRFGITEAAAFTLLLQKDPAAAREVILTNLNALPALNEDSLIGAKRVINSGRKLLRDSDYGLLAGFVERIKRCSTTDKAVAKRLRELIKACS